MSQESDVDLKDVELNEVDQEKQPMNVSNGAAGSPQTEKNGDVKLKIPEETQSKFTGLSKEELLEVAGTPGYKRLHFKHLYLTHPSKNVQYHKLEDQMKVNFILFY